MLIFILCTSILTGCAATDIRQSADAPYEYVINKRSRKIHAKYCPAVAQMSDNNKLLTSDTLHNLLKQDYTICLRCHAGIRKSEAREVWTRLLHANLYVEAPQISATYDDYIDAVSEMSEWYVDHVPTYAAKLQDEPYSKYDGALQHYKEYTLKNNGKTSKHIVISSDLGSPSVDLLSPIDLILRGSENAADNYLDCFKQIAFKKNIAYYPCDLLDEYSDYNTPGDDCVRYMFAVLNLMDGDFTNKYAALSGSSYNRTNSATLATDYKNVAYAFINLGFKIYDTEEQYIDVDQDGIAEGYIFQMDDSFRLKQGDILAREGHVHIYLGNGVVTTADNFGWGRVYRSFPQTYEISIEKNGGKSFVSLINSAGEKEYYNRVYRYIGEKGGE